MDVEEGAKLEVKGLAAEGFPGGWFTAVVVEVEKPSSDRAIVETLHLEYLDFSDAQQSQPATSLRLRPVLPATFKPVCLAEYQVRRRRRRRRRHGESHFK